ncbi:hypothetical protein BC834DRAFT_585827 [Gloeopeniophorella convolvens]|nr:hypothetical protein BC834DRAFT_585827 [Gloeopeniophorella convolvens]
MANLRHPSASPLIMAHLLKHPRPSYLGISALDLPDGNHAFEFPEAHMLWNDHITREFRTFLCGLISNAGMKELDRELRSIVPSEPEKQPACNCLLGIERLNFAFRSFLNMPQKQEITVEEILRTTSSRPPPLSRADYEVRVVMRTFLALMRGVRLRRGGAKRLKLAVIDDLRLLLAPGPWMASGFNSPIFASMASALIAPSDRTPARVVTHESSPDTYPGVGTTAKIPPRDHPLLTMSTGRRR